jgi:hexulose-6-phosphate isomerase
MNRRQFLTTSAAVPALGMLACPAARAAGFRGKLRKAMIVGEVTEAALTPLKAAGFDGVESNRVCSEEDAAKGRAIAAALGMRVHSVLLGWMEFDNDDPVKVAAVLEKSRVALRAAKAYGADAILLVPCRIGGMPMPEPWEFTVEFDDATGHLTRVGGDRSNKYEAYLKAHNHAIDASRAAIQQLIPLAEELKVVIGVENVWNNLWVQPPVWRHFLASFASPWVKAYFDIGNHVKYAPPQEWIRILGPLLAKLHVKDFKLNPDGHGGEFVHPRDGSVDWPAVRRALDDAGYDGWATIEDQGLDPAEFSRRFDLIAEGK